MKEKLNGVSFFYDKKEFGNRRSLLRALEQGNVRFEVFKDDKSIEVYCEKP